MLIMYALTEKGMMAAHTTRFPDQTEWAILHCPLFRHHGTATKDQIATYCGASSGEASSALTRLKVNGFVYEVGGARV